jgi:hypothetical protein
VAGGVGDPIGPKAAYHVRQAVTWLFFEKKPNVQHKKGSFRQPLRLPKTRNRCKLLNNRAMRIFKVASAGIDTDKPLGQQTWAMYGIYTVFVFAIIPNYPECG